MKYVFIDDDGYAGEQVPEFDPLFPDVPIEERYSASFVDRCIAVDDSVEVLPGSKYDTEAGAFFVEEPETPLETGGGEAPRPDPGAMPTVWDELDAAYQEGVDSVD